MAEAVALTSNQMFVEIRYKSLYMETYMVKQIISPPIKLFTLAEIFICKQINNKILTWFGRRNDTFFANRPLTGVTITFIRCLYRVTGVSIGQGVKELRYCPKMKVWFYNPVIRLKDADEIVNSVDPE